MKTNLSVVIVHIFADCSPLECQNPLTKYIECGNCLSMLSSRQPGHNCWLVIHESCAAVQSNCCEVQQCSTDVYDACCVRLQGQLEGLTSVFDILIMKVIFFTELFKERWRTTASYFVSLDIPHVFCFIVYVTVKLQEKVIVFPDSTVYVCVLLLYCSHNKCS